MGAPRSGIHISQRLADQVGESVAARLTGDVRAECAQLDVALVDVGARGGVGPGQG